MIRKIVVALLLASGITVGATVSPAGADTTVLRTTLTGGNERPGPGDPDARGWAVVIVDDETNEVCLVMTWINVDGTPSGLHIHRAPTTSPGPITIPFATPSPGTNFTYQCVIESEEDVNSLLANPSGHYLNLHSTPNFGPGAIRGQLQG
jgi:hypothetical protein